MASKKDTFKVKKYTIKASAFGNGSYGTVHEATDERRKKIAAKAVNMGKEKIKNLADNLDKLLQLNHRNIVDMFDKHIEENKIWIFMEYCDVGDLNKYFAVNKQLELDEKLECMTQIAQGLEYLHGNNVIHRDIKPGNILVASTATSTPCFKLADFDLSKILDPDDSTSAMSSNVGTRAFKAPEFFQRNEQHKIRYHRHVDIYALALTYLAIEQAKEEAKMLIPRIETPQEDSELHLPIGPIIAERIKYKVKELNIVVIDGASDNTRRTEIKKLIRMMTCIEPSDRLSAAEVIASLAKIKAGTFNELSSQLNQMTTDSGQASATSEVSQIRLNKHLTWATDMNIVSMCVVSADQLAAHGRVGRDLYIRVFDKRTGAIVKDIPSKCRHDHRLICALPSSPKVVIESCYLCELLRTYNLENEEAKTVYKRCKAKRMCSDSLGSVFVIDWQYHLLHFEWQNDTEELQLTRNIKTTMPGLSLLIHWDANRMCYMKQEEILVFSCDSPKSIQAIRATDGTAVWQFAKQVRGRAITPLGVTADKAGRVYIADQMAHRILLLNGRTGQMLQILLQEDKIRDIWDLFWAPNRPQLVVLQARNKSISCYDVTE